MCVCVCVFRALDDEDGGYVGVQDSQEVCTTSFSTSPPSQVTQLTPLILVNISFFTLWLLLSIFTTAFYFTFSFLSLSVFFFLFLSFLIVCVSAFGQCVCTLSPSPCKLSKPLPLDSLPLPLAPGLVTHTVSLYGHCGSVWCTFLNCTKNCWSLTFRHVFWCVCCIIIGFDCVRLHHLLHCRALSTYLPFHCDVLLLCTTVLNPVSQQCVSNVTLQCFVINDPSSSSCLCSCMLPGFHITLQLELLSCVPLLQARWNITYTFIDIWYVQDAYISHQKN